MGNFEFEKKVLHQHLLFYEKYLDELLHIKQIVVRFNFLQPEQDNGLFSKVTDYIQSAGWKMGFQKKDFGPAKQQYYKRLQFKIYIQWDGREFEIGDGGFVDWSQKLTGNKKERMLISGLGLELLYKILNNMV